MLSEQSLLNTIHLCYSSNGGIELTEYKVGPNGSNTEKVQSSFINDKSELVSTQFATITVGGLHKELPIETTSTGSSKLFLCVAAL